MAFDVFWISAIPRSKLPAKKISHATLIAVKVMSAAPSDSVPQKKRRNYEEKKALATEMPESPAQCFLASMSADESCFVNESRESIVESREKYNAFVLTIVEVLENAAEEKEGAWRASGCSYSMIAMHPMSRVESAFPTGMTLAVVRSQSSYLRACVHARRRRQGSPRAERRQSQGSPSARRSAARSASS
jgi:hypothetical protein